MPDSAAQHLTDLLDALNGSAPNTFAALAEAVYADLKRIAGNELHRRFDQPMASLTLSRTAIAHDAIMKLRDQHAKWDNRQQFFAIATRLIQQLVIDYQRVRLADKRGGGQRGVPIDGLDPAIENPLTDDDCAIKALDRLHEQYPRQAEVASLHAICQLALPKVAGLIGVSLRTVERDWQLARAFLARELAT